MRSHHVVFTFTRAHGAAALGALAALALASACDGGAVPMDDVPAAEVQQTASAVLNGLPAGLTCGLGYYRNGVNVAMGRCQGLATATAAYSDCYPDSITMCIPNWPNMSCAPGFLASADGDRGLCLPWGLYHQSLQAGLNDLANADQLALPQGTACGFKESCNDTSETCMGLDPRQTCPKGWVRKVASDSNAPSNCGYYWCEYQDPNHLCTGNCQYQNQMSGLVCGISDNDRPSTHGTCLGVNTATGQCPAGWAWYGWFDDGRSVGHGIGWCYKP